MGRPSNREERRRQIIGAFRRVLADQGYVGATIIAVAAEAGVAPGLVHHHFESKADLMRGLLRDLVARFRARVQSFETTGDPLTAYVNGALRLDARADVATARCWVGVFAEAMRDPSLFAQLRRQLDSELVTIRERSGGRLSESDAGAVLAFIIGALVLGAFAPRKTSGFAAPGLEKMVSVLASPGATNR
jgi:TetR/AcrR family transcriptional regulator, transcriptional repressor of bet genes